jgi:hypothetical protein
MENPHGFEKHLFISYSHIDNQPLTTAQEGWVSRFHASLEAMLSMRIGGRAEVWRDPKLAGNDILGDEIMAQLAKAAVLVSVVSPSYIKSEWCRRELQEFCNLAEKSGSLVIDNKSRIFKVIKIPIESEESLPRIMKDMLGYEFFVLDKDQAPLELDPTYSLQQYLQKMAALAFGIFKALQRQTLAATGGLEKATNVAKPTIYLAECSYDQREAREALERDLRRHGYTVLPDSRLSTEEALYVAEVARLLKQSQISIHLIGTHYGAVPDGPRQESVVVLQNELAIAESKASGLKRIIWLPGTTESRHAAHRQFLEALRADAETQFGADLVSTDLENLKEVIRANLDQIERPTPHRGSPRAGTRLVYIICDERDRSAALPLRKLFKNHGFDTEIPPFGGEASELRQANQDLLTQCDAVLVFYGAAGEAWKRSVDRELLKIRAYRGEKPLPANYTYVAEPATEHKKELIELAGQNILNGLEGFHEAQMQPVITGLRNP